MIIKLQLNKCKMHTLLTSVWCVILWPTATKSLTKFYIAFVDVADERLSSSR